MIWSIRRHRDPDLDIECDSPIEDLIPTLAGLTRRLFGDPARQRLNESDLPSVAGRVYNGMSAWDNRQMPTATQRRDVEIATSELATLTSELDGLVNGEIAKLRAALEAAGAPWIPKR